jgi:hypothetical protein
MRIEGLASKKLNYYYFLNRIELHSRGRLEVNSTSSSTLSFGCWEANTSTTRTATLLLEWCQSAFYFMLAS